MVKIHIEHVFHDITPQQFWGLLLSPDFDRALQPALGVKMRQELERKDEGNTIKRKARVIPGFPIPGAVQKLFGDKELEYLEESTFYRDRQVMDWSSKPNLFAEKVKAAGQVIVKPEGNGVRRTITGEISVDIFGVGRIMEGAVKDNVERSYERASDLTRQWIREGKHKNMTVA